MLNEQFSIMFCLNPEENTLTGITLDRRSSSTKKMVCSQLPPIWFEHNLDLKNIFEFK